MNAGLGENHQLIMPEYRETIDFDFILNVLTLMECIFTE